MSYPTGSDLNSKSLVPPLGARQAPDIGPVAVLVSTEPDVRTMGSLVEKVRQGPFFMGRLFKTEKGVTIAGPYIGAPYAVMLLESLVAKGARQIIVLGWCGALTRDLAIGDLILPDRAICDEGTSGNYQALDPDLGITFPDRTLSEKLAGYLSVNAMEAGQRPVWTTDAIYRETPEKVAWFTKRGAAAVDMECSALFAAARYRKVRLTSLLVVSDSLASKDWDPGFRKKRFKEARKQACKAVLSFAHGLGEDR
ncbi:nucleoside phosphorylase [Desulfospira joergensenii]|uniref:nucleoside phosphorylase n=1 Tax=Desulfospira joergensenii TaxID=53329 RepID=UPI0003B55E22|nr:nucleoside phosphorylase [Desulfospira joergensenii]